MTRRSWTRYFLMACAGVAIAGLLLWRAAKQPPDFYRAAVEMPVETAAKGNDEMLARAADLASQARKQGDWHARFTEQQINGWLAVDLPRNHPDLLPHNIRSPRVAIEPGRLRVAGQYLGSISTVLSLEIDAYLTQPNVVALRLRRVRAGSLPMPMQKVLDAISEALADSDVRVTWQTVEGDPVAMLEWTPLAADGRHVTLTALEVRQGEIVVEGNTNRSRAR